MIMCASPAAISKMFPEKPRHNNDQGQGFGDVRSHTGCNNSCHSSRRCPCELSRLAKGNVIGLAEKVWLHNMNAKVAEGNVKVSAYTVGRE